MKADRFEVKILCGFFLFVFVCLTTGNALAHRVTVFAWVDGDTIHVQSKFPGGRSVKGGKITVLDPRANELVSGNTNERGEFSFKIPRHSDLKIILTAGQGHQAEWNIPVAELGPATPSSNRRPAGGSQTPSATTGTLSEKQPPVVKTFTPGELEAMIESALDKKLKPVIKMLAESRQAGPSAKEIIGGIGYIVGLVGIAAYLHSRRKNRG